MPEPVLLTREEILDALTSALEPLPFVDAMWEGGAAAFDRLDEWSDIDLYVIAADDRVAETFRAIEDALNRLSPVRLKYEPVWPPESGIAQAFYRLEWASEYLLVDLAVLTRSAPDKFLETEIHGQPRFAFNKGDTLRVPHLDVEAFTTKVLQRRERLLLRMDLFGPFLSKELRRRNWLGALDAYEKIVLDSLAQALRMRYAPAHYGFSIRYAVYDLPPEAVHRLQDLSYVRSPEELEEKSRVAEAWFRETMAAVTPDGVRAQLREAPQRPG